MIGQAELGGPIDARHGDWFIPSVTGPVGSLEVRLAAVVAAGLTGAGPASAEFWLTADAGLWPGEVIDVFRFESIPYISRPWVTPLLGANSTLQPMLTAGTRYWIIGVAPAGPTVILWSQNEAGEATVGQHCWRLLRADGTYEETLTHEIPLNGGFRLNGDLLQDPPDPAPVPEPATLLLVASGILGLGSRRLRTRTQRKKPDGPSLVG